MGFAVAPRAYAAWANPSGAARSGMAGSRDAPAEAAATRRMASTARRGAERCTVVGRFASSGLGPSSAKPASSPRSMRATPV
jgi:hypothetical protein